KKARTTVVVTELDNYLNEDVLPRSSDFDILMWWKLSGLKYPILQAVARDDLAIPVTSVASESAFSSECRLLDPHHSKLHSATVEALMCTRSWLKDEYERDPAVGNNIVELEGCFTALDIISGSDDEPIDIEDQGVSQSQVPPRSTTDYNLDDID
ncbi:Putative AC9 transposase, partial [Linum perenne]